MFTVYNFFILLFLLFNQKDCIKAECIISIKDDMISPHALLVSNSILMKPENDGFIHVEDDERVMVACPGKNRYVVFNNSATDLANTKQVESVELQCGMNNTFQNEFWTGKFRDVKCNSAPWFNAVYTSKICYGGNKIISVGFNVSDKFHTIYESCFDPGLLRTYYVEHILEPTADIRQPVKNRINFVGKPFFDNVPVADAYKLKNELRRFDMILGEGIGSKFLSSKQFLNRGHLAPRADFSLRNSQRTSFHYVNAAPQWKLSNAGDWSALEQSLRSRVKTLRSPLRVYTGTHGVASLPDKNGVLQELYLYTDNNNNYVIPVPLYFYKLVYEPVKKLATVFLSINNPYIEGPEKFIFCTDICSGNTNFKWIKWRHNDNTTSFCCSYEEFVKIVDTLPKLDVLDLFY